MSQESIIDLSEVRQTKVEKKLSTLDQVRECVQVYTASMQEALLARFEQMQRATAMVESKIQTPPGMPDPRNDIGMRLKFLDGTVARLTDLIYASAVVLDHEKDPTLLNAFPPLLAKYQDVIEAIVINRDKSLQETTHAEQMLLVSYRDLAKYREMLNLVR